MVNIEGYQFKLPELDSEFVIVTNKERQCGRFNTTIFDGKYKNNFGETYDPYPTHLTDHGSDYNFNAYAAAYIIGPTKSEKAMRAKVSMAEKILYATKLYSYTYRIIINSTHLAFVIFVERPPKEALEGYWPTLQSMINNDKKSTIARVIKPKAKVIKSKAIAVKLAPKRSSQEDKVTSSGRIVNKNQYSSKKRGSNGLSKYL